MSERIPVESAVRVNCCATSEWIGIPDNGLLTWRCPSCGRGILALLAIYAADTRPLPPQNTPATDAYHMPDRTVPNAEN